MADKTFSKTCSAVGSFSYAGNFKLYVELTNTGEDVSANTSKVKYNVYCQKPSDKGGSISAKHLKYFKINGKEVVNETVNVDASGYPAKISIASGTTSAIEHKDDGTKTISFSAKIKASSFGVSATIEDDFTLDTIPRYFSSTPTISANSKTETTYKFNWSTSETCSKVVLYVNGTAKKTLSDLSAKSGTIQATGLSPGTEYDVYVKCTRKDSGLTSNSSTKQYTTSKYPYIKSVSTTELVIGNSQTLTLYNPLSRSVTIKMYQNNTSGTQLYSGTTTGTSITFTPNANTLYSTIPNAQSGKCVYSAIYSSSTETISGDYKYKIKGTEKPDFSKGVDVFSDSHYSLTGDSYKVILGYSNMMATIPYSQKASAKNYSSIKTYKMVVGSKSVSKSEDPDSGVSLPAISAVTSNQATISAIDSRGLSTSKTVSLTAINYFTIKINSISARRTNNIEPKTTLSFNVGFWNGNFGAVKNTIKTIYYRYKKTTDSSWTNGATKLSYTASGNTATGSINIKGDLGDEGFNIENSYNIYLYVQDELSSHSATATLTTGLPAIAIYGNKVAIGAKYDTAFGQALQVYGEVRLTDKTRFSAITKTRTINGSDYSASMGVGNISSQGTVAFELYDSAGTVLNRIDMTPDRTIWGRGEGKLYSPNSSGIYFDKWGNIQNQRAGSEGGNWSISSDSTILSMDWKSGVSTFYYGISARSYISFANGGGTSYAGICNSSGVPIIRDHNNKNVTVDATGGTLILGFQNTTGLDFFDGSMSMSSTQFNSKNINCSGWLVTYGTLRPGSNGSYTLGASNYYWSTGYINRLYFDQLQEKNIGADVITGDTTNIYFGTSSSSSDKVTNIRGNTVRLYAHTKGVYLGSSGSTAVTSDENLKNIYEVDNKYIDFFNKLKPINYIYKQNGHRKHFGFGARQVEQALLDSGLTTEEFAGVLIDKDVTISADENQTGKDIHYDELYSLRYEEFVSLNTLMIQKALKEIQEIKNKIGG